ncbi:MAG TPA: ABC transporter ATP-binding protein [Bacillota bacterium]|nr:ABC transporter ATP-binding protein [Bacillota bacterium]
MSDNIIDAYGLTKSYGSLKALDEFAITVTKGKVFGLLGPNGSGKTTFIKLCAGLLTPDSGHLRVCDEGVGAGTKALVSYLPEAMYFPQWMKISECMAIFDDFYADFDRTKATEMLAALQVDGAKRIRELSKGMKEKLQLVLVMSRRARLYLLDEPIAGVDPASRDYILDTIIRSYSADAAVVISTHLISDIEKALDEFAFLSYGKIVMQMTPDEAREKYGKSVDALFREVFRCFVNY